MTSKQLSTRLWNVADMVPNDATIADIGSDHAYVPVHLLKQNKIKYAIAGEVTEGPLRNAESAIQKNELSKKMESRIGDGLDVINSSDGVDTIVIAGMGGELISEILERGRSKLETKPTLILEPNIDEKIVRHWLVDNGYQISEERIVSDSGHFYEMMRAERSNGCTEYSDEEFEFGPKLLKERSEIFKEKWNKVFDKNKIVLTNLLSAKDLPTDKITEIKKINAELKDILDD